MAWPDTDRDRLEAAHRAIRILIAQLHVTGQMDAVGLALADDTEASCEVLAATGRVDKALDDIAVRREHEA